MIHLDHLTIFVADVARSREWYTQRIGLKLEFEIPGANVAALQDDGGLTLYVEKARQPGGAASCVLTFRVADVEAKCRELTDCGVMLAAQPQKLFWGYGAELRDPDGYLIRVWDEISMREKG